MKYEIEQYKGQTIFYDDDNDKFICVISIEDQYKKTQRQSLKDVRKEIDTFIKLNSEFKPFKMLQKNGWRDIETIEVTGIRTDGKFLVKKSENYTSHETLKKLMDDYGMYDPEIEREMKTLKDALNKANDLFQKGKDELCKRIKPLDLSKCEHLTTKTT